MVHLSRLSVQQGRTLLDLVRRGATFVLVLALLASSIPYEASAAIVTKQITATGGTITEVMQNGVKYRIHTFTTTGTSTFRVMSGTGKIWYLVVAGGGGGAQSSGSNGGGGGAGGLLTNGGYTYTVNPGAYTVTVGSGDAVANTRSLTKQFGERIVSQP